MAEADSGLRDSSPSAAAVGVRKRFARILSLFLSNRTVTAVANLCFVGIASRYLSVARFGELILILAVTSFMELCFMGGLDTILLREQSQQPDNGLENFRNSFLPVTCMSGITLLITGAIAFHFRADPPLTLEMIISGLASAIHITLMLPVAFYRADENIRYETKLVVLERCLFVIGLVAVVLLKGGIPAILACLLFSITVKVSLGYWIFFRDRKYTLGPPRLAASKYLVLESLPLTVGTFLFALKWRTDLFMLKALGSAVQVGIYAASFRLMDMIKVFPIDVMMAAFPILCKLAMDSHEGLGRFYNMVVRWSLVAGFLLCGLLFLHADLVIGLLYGPHYKASVSPFRLLVLVYPLMFWSQVNNITLTAKRKQKCVAYSLVAAFVLQAAVDRFLIPRIGITGAATGFVVNELAFIAGTLTFLQVYAVGCGPTLYTFVRVLFATLVAAVIPHLVTGLSVFLSISMTVSVYLLMLPLLGLVTPDELLGLQRLLTNLARNGTRPMPTGTP